jgi:hypothetical protein
MIHIKGRQTHRTRPPYLIVIRIQLPEAEAQSLELAFRHATDRM